LDFKLALLNSFFFFSQYEKPYITIDLKQNTSDKSPGGVDIADVAYYFEKDVSVSWVKPAKDQMSLLPCIE